MVTGLKKVPKSVLVFGASGRWGSQVIHALQQEQPDIRLRLVTTSESKKPELEKAWQLSEVVVADFFNDRRFTML